jgi:hypothetical protein
MFLSTLCPAAMNDFCHEIGRWSHPEDIPKTRGFRDWDRMTDPPAVT